MLLPLVVFMFWLGVRPGLVLDRVEASVARVLAPLAVEGAAPAGHGHGASVEIPALDLPDGQGRFVFGNAEMQ